MSFRAEQDRFLKEEILPRFKFLCQECDIVSLFLNHIQVVTDADGLGFDSKSLRNYVLFLISEKENHSPVTFIKEVNHFLRKERVSRVTVTEDLIIELMVQRESDILYKSFETIFNSIIKRYLSANTLPEPVCPEMTSSWEELFVRYLDYAIHISVMDSENKKILRRLDQ